MSALADRIPLPEKHTFSIMSEVGPRHAPPGSSVDSTILRNGFTCLSIANTHLLEVFFKQKGKGLIKDQFIHLKRDERLANPEFTRLHSVRYDEIGWGFDANMCLSLYLVFVENSKLYEYSIYTQKIVAKTEQEG